MKVRRPWILLNPLATTIAFLPGLGLASLCSPGTFSSSGTIPILFGTSLGLSASDINDINGNASHNIFASLGPLNIVDRDASANVISPAFSSSVPGPGGLLLMGRGTCAPVQYVEFLHL
jgi:hypothetical protein